jgi:adenosine kinase
MIKLKNQYKKLLLGIGSPILDIIANVELEIMNKYGLKWATTVFANENNKAFFDHVTKLNSVKYIPGGSICNSIRIANVRIALHSGYLMTITVAC